MALTQHVITRLVVTAVVTHSEVSPEMTSVLTWFAALSFVEGFGLLACMCACVRACLGACLLALLHFAPVRDLMKMNWKELRPRNQAKLVRLELRPVCENNPRSSCANTL